MSDRKRKRTEIERVLDFFREGSPELVAMVWGRVGEIVEGRKLTTTPRPRAKRRTKAQMNASRANGVERQGDEMGVVA